MHENTCPPLTRHELRSSCAFDNLVGPGGFRPEEPPQRRVSKPRLTCRPGMGKADSSRDRPRPDVRLFCYAATQLPDI